MNADAQAQVAGERFIPHLASVVILNHNGAALIEMLRKNVTAVLAQDYKPIELFLVDDNSTDGSDAQVQALCAETGATFLSTRNGNHGICAARNLGLSHSRGEFIAFLDNDAIPQPGWLAALVRRLEADPTVGSVASRAMFIDKPDLINSLGSVLNELFYGNNVCIHELVDHAVWPEEVMYATGNGMALRRQAVEQVGLFDEGYLFWGADDADYGMRLGRAGWRCAPVPDAVVSHLHSASKQQSGMPFWDGRNRVRMALKHQSWREVSTFVVRDLRWVPRGQRRQYVRCWWSTLTHWPGFKELLAYRWQHRGESSYAKAFRRFLVRPNHMLIAADNRAYGREFRPLEVLRAGEDDEPYLYHGWYWPEHWGHFPMRWAMRSASLVLALPRGAEALNWRLLPRPEASQTALTLIVQRHTPTGYIEVQRQRILLPGPPEAEPDEVTTAVNLTPGEYRLVLLADTARIDPGLSPRQIGFGLVELTVSTVSLPCPQIADPRMRILQVPHVFMPESAGGTEVHTHLLSKMLQARHASVSIYYRIFDKSRPEHELLRGSYDGLRVYKLVNNFAWSAGPDFDWFDPGQEAKFEAVLDAEHPDVVHFQHLGGGLSTSLAAIARRRGLPIVLTLHDYWPMCYNSQLLTADGRLCPGPEGGMRCAQCWLKGAVEQKVSIPHRVREVGLRNALRMAPRYLLDYLGVREYLPPVAYQTTRLMCRNTYMHQVLAQCDMLLAPSRFLREQYIAWGVPPERIQFVQNGVDPSKFEGLERTLPNGPTLHAVYMGSLVQHKGLDVLIDAFNQLTDVPVELAIYGNISSNRWVKEYVRTLRSRNQNPRVIFKGQFPNQDVARVLADADVAIVPSTWYENCPMVILEAQYAGRPVICSNVGGMAELIQDGVNGLTFRLGDAGHLAEKVRLLAQNRDLLLSLQRGITPPAAMSTVAVTVEGIYQRLLDERAGARGQD